MQVSGNTRWRVIDTKAGTRYVKDKEPPREPRPALLLPSQHLEPLMKGEAEGDYILAAIMAVRNLLAKPQYWNRGKARALDKRGEALAEPIGVDAVSWSVIGAVQFITHPADRNVRHLVIEAIKKGLPKDERQSLYKWEEKPTTKHSNILHALNMAIAFRRNELGLSARPAK